MFCHCVPYSISQEWTHWMSSNLLDKYINAYLKTICCILSHYCLHFNGVNCVILSKKGAHIWTQLELVINTASGKIQVKNQVQPNRQEAKWLKFLSNWISCNVASYRVPNIVLNFAYIPPYTTLQRTCVHPYIAEFCLDFPLYNLSTP